jgi:hypothetical protein
LDRPANALNALLKQGRSFADAEVPINADQVRVNAALSQWICVVCPRHIWFLSRHGRMAAGAGSQNTKA